MGQKTQIIKGFVKDKITQQPIIGASILVEGTSLGAATDLDGNFEMKSVPVGRHSLICTYIGYESYVSEAFILSSVKSLYIEIEMLEGGINLNEVVISGGSMVNKPINELAVVSTRSFTADETDRIAASVNDPGRLALAYPGVAQGADDNENDIIIRGNSSFGMIWRLEGVDIPNPNHFARPGTSGGGITIFSAQLLSRSDFSTGGMPAEYGNALSGAMDIHFRKGNKTENQYRFKLGVLGIDVATEGPLKQNNSSYLVNYRYSTLGILTNMGIYLVGERVTNDFQDLSFNIALDGDDKNRFTIFGMGGLSREHYNPVDDLLSRDSTDSSHWEDRIRDSNMGAIGGTYTRFIDKKSFLKAAVAVMRSEIEFFYDVLDNNNTRSNYHDERHNESRISSSVTYSRKVNSNLRLKTGLLVNNILNYDFYKRTIARRNISDVIVDNSTLAINGSGSTSTIQYYAQFSADLNEQVTINAGGHFLHLFLNNRSSLEPRISMKYQMDPRQNISLAYGLYGKILPMAGYFFTERDTTTNGIIETLPNFDLPMIKSHHLVASYNFATENGLRFTAEAYYQALFNVPISDDPDDFYWMLNRQANFPEEAVFGEGTGENYGLDLALEKFFSSKVYFLLTGSFFKSYFYPKNGIRYHTTFANDFVSALTIGREFELKNDKVLQVGTRVMFNGGNRYTPLDEAASLAEERYVPDENLTNTERIPNYFRIDARIAYRYNSPKLAGSISLDIQNILDYKNPSSVAYSADLNELFFP